MNLYEMRFEIKDSEGSKLYLYDNRFVYKGVIDRPINFANGTLMDINNSTPVPMNLANKEGYVIRFNPDTNRWEHSKDLSGKVYYYKSNGELVFNPDPNKLHEYTETPKTIPNGVYNEELDKFIYPVTDYRDILKQRISDNFNEERTITFQGTKFISSELSLVMMRKVLKNFRIDIELQEQNVFTVPENHIDENGNEISPDLSEDMGETTIPDLIIPINFDDANSLYVLFLQDKDNLNEMLSDEFASIDNMSDEEVERKQIEDIKAGIIYV